MRPRRRHRNQESQSTVPIAESDISILIPTYRYRDKVVRALQSALDSGAGEIIVVDDCGRDGTMERLAAFSDPRLIVRENERNVGLWENHLGALKLATKPWIKFIQADDYLLPGGLAAFAAAVEPGVSVVWGARTVKDDTSGTIWYYYTFTRPIHMFPRQMQDAFVCCGWILGSPSHQMWRSDVIERDPAAWTTAISTDLVVGSIAAARGDTVLLPPGAIGQGAHPLQDAKTQSSNLGLQRTSASLAYLRRRPEPGLRRLANLWTLLALKPSLRTAARGIIRREAPVSDIAAPALSLCRDLSWNDWQDVMRANAEVRRGTRFRRATQLPINFDRVMEQLHSSRRETVPA